MGTRELRLGDREDLAWVRSATGVFRRPTPRRVVLCGNLAELPDRERLERRLAMLLNACGCTAGSLAMVVAIAWRIVVADGWSTSPWTTVGATGLWTVTFAALAKLGALALSWWLLRILFQRLERAAGLIHSERETEQSFNPVG